PFEDDSSTTEQSGDSSPEIGTVNLIVGSDRSLDESGLATLLGVVVEAKAATLQQLTGFSGTTSDAVIVGTNRRGEPSTFAGSATRVGDAVRAAVRDAVREGLAIRYTNTDVPDSVDEADSGIVTDRSATVFEL
ncbi:MAG: adenosylcobinamide amidohydrolase, partial [Halodesulfurarchaeum sp.]